MTVMMLPQSDKISPSASKPCFGLRFPQHESRVQRKRSYILASNEGHLRMPSVKSRPHSRDCFARDDQNMISMVADKWRKRE